jgi:hypothetical protein
MTRVRLQQLRECIRRGHYDLTQHAVEEMAEDAQDIFDVEAAVLTGEIHRLERDDPRGTKCVIRGMSYDRRTSVGVVGRLVEAQRFLIITVYEVT